MYDSIDYVVACGFMACVLPRPKFQQESHVNTFKSDSQLITLCLQSSIVVFKPEPLTVTIVTKSTYYYYHLCRFTLLVHIGINHSKGWTEEDTQLIPSSFLFHINVVETSCRSASDGFCNVTCAMLGLGICTFASRRDWKLSGASCPQCFSL